jgi:hypothetical protein
MDDRLWPTVVRSMTRPAVLVVDSLDRLLSVKPVTQQITFERLQSV